MKWKTMGVEDLKTANIYNLLYRATQRSGLTGWMIEGTAGEKKGSRRENS